MRSVKTLNLNFVSKLLIIATAFFLPLSVAITNILFVVTPILFLFSGNLRAKLGVIFHNPVALTMLAFFSLFVIGLGYTSAPIHDALLTLIHYDKIFFAALMFPLFVEKKWRKYAINAFVIGALFLLALSYLKDLGIHSFFNIHDEALKGHIVFGFIMALVSYILMLNILETKNNYYRVLFALIWILVVFDAIFLSIGRSGYFVFVGLLTLLFFQKFKWKGALIALVSAALLCGFAYSFSGVFKSRINNIASDISIYHQNKVTSLGERITFWRNSVKLIEVSPVFGHGTGSYNHEYANIKPTPPVASTNSHDEYLYIGVQFGLIGIAMLLMLFGVQLWQSKNLPRGYNYLAQAIVLSIALGCFANSWLLDSAEGHIYAYFIALTFAAL